MTNKLSLDDKYSTTRGATQDKPKIINKHDILFLPESKEQKAEGGLKTKGYFKKSYEDKPLISIITVVYNGEKYLEETIQSVINQTYDNVEYIIIDGGSTDGTLDIIKKYEDRIDYWVSERDKGIYDAMNKGISHCCGDIIGIVNADDYLYLETLEKIANVFLDSKIMFVYGGLDLISEDGQKISNAKSLGIESVKFKIFKQMPFLHPTMFIKKNVYQTIGLFDTSYRLSADYDFSLRIVERGFIGKDVEFTTGVFRLGGASGGMQTYMENHQVSQNHGTNFIFLYLNTIILITKMWLRNIKVLQ